MREGMFHDFRLVVERVDNKDKDVYRGRVLEN